MNIKRNRKGFSLVELLVVITIIAILSVTAFVALGGQTGNARNARRQQDLSTLQSALETYYIQNTNTYPPDLTALVPNYMVILPVDPADPDDSYDYFRSATGKKYVLGATLEINENYEAYVVSNADDAGIGVGYATEGVNTAAAGGACDILLTGANKADCVPYLLTD